MTRELPDPGDTRPSDDGAARAAVVAELEELDVRLESVWRWRSPGEAAPELTRAYVHLEIAAGLARAGALRRARPYWDQAAARLLPLRDELHALLLDWYGARIRRAAEGLPLLASTEAELARRRAAMNRFCRYKLDRLRLTCRVLEPSGDLLDPVTSFMSEDAELAGLDTIDDAAALDARLRDLLPSRPGAIDRVLATVICVAGRFGPGAAGVLRRIWDTLPRLDQGCWLGLIGPLARALDGAALVGELADHLERRLSRERLPGAGVAVREVALALRAAGQADRAGQLVDLGFRNRDIADRVAVAVAAAALGRLDAARRSVHGALCTLEQRLPACERLDLARSVADVASFMPPAEAIALLRRLLPQVAHMRGSLTTSTHFCLHEVAFADVMVMGLVGERLAVHATAPRAAGACAPAC